MRNTTKTKTKTQIKIEAKKLYKELKSIYNKLDNLMDESTISAQGMTPEEFSKGKANWFNQTAFILGKSRDYTELAYDDLEAVTIGK